MLTTIRTTMLALVMTVAMVGLGCSGADDAPLPADAAGADTGAADATASEVSAPGPELVGSWCSSFAEVDLHADGTYQETSNGAQSAGGWASDGKTYLTFLGPNGEAGASQTIVSLTSTTLTLNGFSGTLVFSRCP